MNCRVILDEENFDQLLQYLEECETLATISIVARSKEKYSNFIIKNTSYLPDECSIYFRLCMLQHKIDSIDKIPRCKNCGKILQDGALIKYFRGVKPVFCSRKCFNTYPKKEETCKKISNSNKKRWANTSDEEKRKIYEKVEQTNLAKYGTKCTLNTEDGIRKKKDTWIKKYGVDNPFKDKTVRQRIEEINLARYGSICPLNNSKIKEKSQQTLYKHYGVYNPMDSDVIKDKIRKNCKEKYGTDWHIKRDDVWIKTCITMETYKRPNYRKYRVYKYPSGKEIIVQGYEDIALDYYILKRYNENDIENSITFMNSLCIKYKKIDGTEHRYIPDFFVKSENLIIEVKSEFTFYVDLDTNLSKAKATIDLGYDIIFLVIYHIDRKNSNIKYKIYNYEDIKIEKEKNCK